MRLLILIMFFFYGSSSWRFLPLKKKINSRLPKSFISISPSGFYGFYTLGISSFIKNNYNIENYNYLGASSGSWGSLLSCYKHDNLNLVSDLLNQDFLEKSKNAYSLQKSMSKYLLDKYETEDFNLDKLHISLSEYNRFKLSNKVITNFTSLEDAINCCISSSHIPLITSNKLINIYRGKIVFDGGFTKFPPTSINNTFIITSNCFNYADTKNAFLGIITRNISSDIAIKLFNMGYFDSKKNKKYLDNYFDKGDYLFYMDYF
tara:strand:- start:6604 stop:7389 length:786 start_codon:yes stop_codon:yes gene_type:complete